MNSITHSERVKSTASSEILDALQEYGVEYIFGNFGSDHPALLEAIACAKVDGRPLPKVVTAPFEMVGLSAAQGYAQATGRPAAVVVHVECGTQCLAGAVHNAARSRSPVFIFAGLSPATQSGEVLGSRNEFIHWLQDVPDQRAIVRQYMKHENEIRVGASAKQLTFRALQLACTEPKGPVYLVGAREVMEQSVAKSSQDRAGYEPVSPCALRREDVAALIGGLEQAERPLIVTSFVGRQPDAVAELVRFCRRMGIGVLESVPSCMNFPADDPLHQGVQWNQQAQNPALAEADFVLVIDSDVPWIPTVNRPASGALVHHIDVDPLKASIPLWTIRATRSYAACSHTALRQLNEYIDEHGVRADVESRSALWGDLHHKRRQAIALAELPQTDRISAEHVVAAVRRHAGEDAICLSEAVTNYQVVSDHMWRNRPGTYFASGGGSLNWNGGAAIGVKLAHPDRTVVAFTGDGSFMMGAPSSVFWMARRYNAPFLQVVFNNGGWNAPRNSTVAIHPDGHASRGFDLDIGFSPPPDYAGIAEAAGGAWGRRIVSASEVEAAVIEALEVVRTQRRAAVLDVQVN